MLRRGLPVEYSYSIKDSFYFKMCISFLFFFFKKSWWGKEGGQGPPPAWALISYCVSDNTSVVRLQNSPYFCVFKYARAVKQKVWNEAENRERDWGETLKIRFFFSCLTREAHALRARKTLAPRFTDFFTVFEKKTDCFAV